MIAVLAVAVLLAATAEVRLPPLPAASGGCELRWAVVSAVPPSAFDVRMVTKCGGLWCEQAFVIYEGRVVGRSAGLSRCTADEMPEPHMGPPPGPEHAPVGAP